MIWLASFPRSGNTFFRNVLFEVYGIASSTFHRESNYPVEENYFTYPVVKTHLLPGQLQPGNPDIKKAYLVRDGRDALVSLAHHRKDIIEPGTDFRVNLLEAILSMEGSFFGGWSENVRQWLEVADVVIRFEDLIEDPIREVEKLRAIMDLPEPNLEKLPSFQKLKFGNPHYGSGRQFLDDQEQMQDLARKNFRRGKAGGWKEEMPPEYEAIFWELHGEMMESLGYERGPGVRPVVKPKKPYRILVEGSKVNDPAMDGVKRYNEELLFSLLAFQKKQPDKWQIDVLSNRNILPLPDFLEILLEKRVQSQVPVAPGPANPSDLMGYEHGLLAFKEMVKGVLPASAYRLVSGAYRRAPFRKALRWARQTIIYNDLRKHLSEVQNEYQLIHVPLPQNYFHIRQIDKPFVFTIHDLTHRLFPEFHTRDNTELAEKGMQFISQRKVQAIAVSQATKNDLLKEYPAIPEGRVHVIYEAANRNSFQAGTDPSSLEHIRSKYKLPDKPYLLCLSTLEPRKNLRNTIDAFLQLMQDPANREFHLVVCGRKGWKVGELLDEQHAFASNICFTGYVEEADLPVLYAQAVAMCYVAHYEGFGLPPLEAMQCGTPVLYGDNSAMPEVVGEGGLPVCSIDVGDITAKMEAILHDEALRRELSEKALNRALQFSWLKTAFETLQLYEKTILHENSDHSGPDR